MYLETIADLIALPFPIPPNTEFTVGGYFDAGDGGGGTFIWVLNAAPHDYPDDTGIVLYSSILANDALGYFQRIFSGPVNVRWFGAIYEQGVRDDVTTWVHNARDSQAFADNGTLYFPKGKYPGAFDFTLSTVIGDERNEFNIIGDGQGTILRSNGQTDPVTGQAYPILTLGYKLPAWRWAKVSNLQLDGFAIIEGVGTKWAPGIMYADPGDDEVAGRWKIDQVLFINCSKGVYKPYGGIGNHYINCTFRKNIYGVFANGAPSGGGMHSGCDMYSWCEFGFNTNMGLMYTDFHGGGGQIIVDGGVIEANAQAGIYISYNGDAQMTQCAIAIRNVYFEHNGPDELDMFFSGVRSVRVEDATIFGIVVFNSSVNLFNCARASGDFVRVDDRSSFVAYEHRYLIAPSDKLFVNSISYDATPELYGKWQGSSVWGPLRVVTAVKNVVAMSDHLDSFKIEWVDYNTGVYYGTGDIDYRSVLGAGSNKFKLPANTSVKASNPQTIAHIYKNKYTVWSIHTYTEWDDPTVEDFHGFIISDWAPYTVLGEFYFKPNQWVCSYGMKWVDEDLTIRLALATGPSYATNDFYITDYQIVQFDDLAAANSWVNSRAFACHNNHR